ncbi:putative transporter [Nocardia brasiliensis NBRC 14402]|uniref:ABC transporter permease n=1 Tax=Nocardia brasiliensis TaxID=37326 RepID=UPI0003080F8A|nr:ABC transporter permease [Nocardia brasiliensis]ASF10996.1 ABC transporter permease [Nocardia brasiliensis]GAJ83325.1 putative transporter [Nocardia brasiliensis NBRC 14402]SUB10349.1 ABC transporter efflux protein, DrrB family [Nocardia brasiliensis]
MNPLLPAVRQGLIRGRIELRQGLTNGQDLFGLLFWPLAMLVVLFFMRNASFESSGLLLGSLALPSVIGMLVAINGMIGMGQQLAMDREDGTLLRAKATPNGMVGYLLGKIVQVSGWVVIPGAIVLIPGMFLVDGLALNTAGAWLTLIGVMVLGLLATLPIGAIFGSMFDNPRNFSLMTFPIMGVIAVSGIFYPITSMPGWVQGLAQVFPVYWLGLGMRSAMLPGEAVAIELGQSWRHLETVAVLGVWAVVGLVVAPFVLRRMARRESGSSVAERREKAIQRAY